MSLGCIYRANTVRGTLGLIVALGLTITVDFARATNLPEVCEQDLVRNEISSQLELTLVDYRESYCLEHVANLLKRLAPEDLAGARVLILQPLRGFLADRWVFHAVLEKDGLIYDADYHERGVGVPTFRYLRDMFGEPDTYYECFNFFRTIPAAEYLARFVSVLPWSILHDGGTLHRRQLEEFATPYLFTREPVYHRLIDLYRGVPWDQLPRVRLGN